MINTIEFQGYQPDFIGSAESLKVGLPIFTPGDQAILAPVKGRSDHVLQYRHYSVVQHKVRKFPVLTASNINGSLWKSIPRNSLFKSGDRWLKDSRIAYNYQWGKELYSAPGSDFDKGHMVKREDVQWGVTDEAAKIGAKSTFYYTNAVPQHKDLNRSVWRIIEDYILHKETYEFNLKVNVFTGPVLMDDDPKFISSVRDQEIKIPTLFWKVIYYTRDQINLQRVAFLVGQHSLLEENEIIHPKFLERGASPEERYFLDFDLAETFQVNTGFIEDLTNLQFTPARDPYHDDRARKLILHEVNVRGEEEPSQYIEGLVF